MYRAMIRLLSTLVLPYQKHHGWFVIELRNIIEHLIVIRRREGGRGWEPALRRRSGSLIQLNPVVSGLHPRERKIGLHVRNRGVREIGGKIPGKLQLLAREGKPWERFLLTRWFVLVTWRHYGWLCDGGRLRIPMHSVSSVFCLKCFEIKGRESRRISSEYTENSYEKLRKGTDSYGEQGRKSARWSIEEMWVRVC